MFRFTMPGYLHPEDLDEQFAADCRIDHVVVKTDGDHDDTCLRASRQSVPRTCNQSQPVMPVRKRSTAPTSIR